jgi:Arc/MetJ family transcription regulator
MPDHRVKRITFNADADLLEQAKKALGTTSATDAINRSLAEVVRNGSLSSLARDGVPGLTPEMLRELRRPRTF